VTLAADQVPPVAPPDTAEVAYALFASNWPAPAPGSSKPQRPVLTALLRSFWPQFLLTAVLGVAQLSVMYIGPSLVDRFVEFVRRGGELTEGLQLVAILLAGKMAETLASHHYEFQGQKLGKAQEEGLRARTPIRAWLRPRKVTGKDYEYMLGVVGEGFSPSF